MLALLALLVLLSRCLPAGLVDVLADEGEREFTCFTCTFEEGERELLLYYEASTSVLVKQAKQVKQVPGGSWTGRCACRSARCRIH